MNIEFLQADSDCPDYVISLTRVIKDILKDRIKSNPTVSLTCLSDKHTHIYQLIGRRIL